MESAALCSGGALESYHGRKNHFWLFLNFGLHVRNVFFVITVHAMWKIRCILVVVLDNSTQI